MRTVIVRAPTASRADTSAAGASPAVRQVLADALIRDHPEVMSPSSLMHRRRDNSSPTWAMAPSMPKKERIDESRIASVEGDDENTDEEDESFLVVNLVHGPVDTSPVNPTSARGLSTSLVVVRSPQRAPQIESSAQRGPSVASSALSDDEGGVPLWAMERVLGHAPHLAAGQDGFGRAHSDGDDDEEPFLYPVRILHRHVVSPTFAAGEDQQTSSEKRSCSRSGGVSPVLGSQTRSTSRDRAVAESPFPDPAFVTSPTVVRPTEAMAADQRHIKTNDYRPIAFSSEAEKRRALREETWSVAVRQVEASRPKPRTWVETLRPSAHRETQGAVDKEMALVATPNSSLCEPATKRVGPLDRPAIEHRSATTAAPPISTFERPAAATTLTSALSRIVQGVHYTRDQETIALVRKATLRQQQHQQPQILPAAASHPTEAVDSGLSSLGASTVMNEQPNSLSSNASQNPETIN